MSMKCPVCRKNVASSFKFCPYCGASQPEPDPDKPKHKRTHAARGQGYVYKRGNTWSVRVRKAVYPMLDPVTGEQPKPKIVERTKSGFPTRQAAAAYASQLFAKPKSERNLSLAYYWDVYSTTELPKLHPTRQASYVMAFRRLAPLSNVPVKDISVSDIRSLMEPMNLTYYPANDMKIVLSKLYDLAYADDQTISRDVPKMVVLPPKIEKERDAFTSQEIFNIYDAYLSGNRVAALILIMIYTSMMPGELLHLTSEMIDLDGLVIRNAGMKTKARKQASIAFPPFLKPILQEVMNSCSDPKEPIAQYPCYDTFCRHYYQTLEQANVRKLVPYSCRHTTQTVLALDPTVSQAERAAAMRHSIRMEDRYTHIQEHQAHKAIQKMPAPDQLRQSS